MSVSIECIMVHLVGLGGHTAMTQPPDGGWAIKFTWIEDLYELATDSCY
jgi:hypothetical protein